jgi:taurine dioxygenase
MFVYLVQREAMSKNKLEIKRIETFIGAEVTGIDLSQPLTDGDVQAIKEALWQYKVLVFYDQELTQAQHSRLAKYFGEPEVHPTLAISGLTIPEYPEIVKILPEPDMAIAKKKVNEWHVDHTYKLHPPKMAVLRAVTLPSVGGSTGYANTAHAFQTLDDETKAQIRGLRAIHKPAFGVYESDPEKLKKMEADNPPITRPVVVRHPDSGEEILFVNELHTVGFVGLDEQESRKLLDKLFHHLTRLEFQMRMKWRPHTIAMWDEYATNHYAVLDVNEPRYLERITVAGESTLDGVFLKDL